MEGWVIGDSPLVRPALGRRGKSPPSRATSLQQVLRQLRRQIRSSPHCASAIELRP
jgi:hypothetical protein